jgi:hypothetical protein
MQNPVLRDDLCLGIAEDWKFAVNFLLPDLVCVFLIIDADCDDLNVPRLEFL